MTFDHYEVLTREDGSLWELGRGAMGITYKAFDTNLRVNVALKVINAKYLESEVAQQRFMREARAAAQLRHPNVASVFHLGTNRDAFFYAMEFVDGETVESFIKREGPIDPVVAVRITLQVTRALAAAEKHHLVHRDIKPANLMLVREDDDFLVKVIDFGLAKSIKHEENDELATLSMGGFVGTAHFASPEQLEEKEIDVRSDIYSLGVTLWYMLAGQAPFGGSLAQVMSQHLHKPPPLEKLQNLPACLRAVVGHMIEKNPAQRPQTPAALRGELENCLAEIQAAPPRDEQDFPTAVEGTPPPLPMAGPPPAVRKPSRAIIWTIAVIVLVGAGLFGFWKMRPAQKAIAAPAASAAPSVTATRTPMVAQATAAPVPAASPTAPSGKSPELSRELVAAAEKYEADQDWPRAMDQLATLYHKGIGLKRDDREAFRLYDAAAKLNYLDSAGNLGVLYLTSDETDLGKNQAARTQKAVNLFRNGAAQDNAFCMYLYARCLEAGTGVAANPAEANDWYRRAAEAGNRPAQDWCRQHNVSFDGEPAP